LRRSRRNPRVRDEGRPIPSEGPENLVGRRQTGRALQVCRHRPSPEAPRYSPSIRTTGRHGRPSKERRLGPSEWVELRSVR
jgi:hypothetical protein